jgi:hypothetical protein
MDFNMEKPAFTQNNSRLHAFLRIIPRKGILFRGIIRGKSNFMRNSRKNIKLLLDIHQEPIRCYLMKKRDQKISCYSALSAFLFVASINTACMHGAKAAEPCT